MNKALRNIRLKRYCRFTLLLSIPFLLLGCSSTPSPDELQRSIGASSAKAGSHWVAASPSNGPGTAETAETVNQPKGSGGPETLASFEGQNVPESFGNTSNLDQLPELPGAPHKYLIGPGDVVSVVVWGHQELSGKRVVGPDGNIQLPFVGSFPISGLNADEASTKLTSALREDYLNTAVSVTVDKYSSNQVIVLGHVAHPGVLTFAGDPTLLEALAKAGASTGKDDLGGMPTRCAIVRGKDRVMWVDLRSLAKGSDLYLNIPLQRNDLVFVPDSDAELVYVMGQVKNPGPYPLTANMSFLEALSRAGGPNDNAQQGKIVLARPSNNTEQIIDLEKFVKTAGNNSQLEPGDIVYVPKSGLAQLGYFLQQINPITTAVLFGAAL